MSEERGTAAAIAVSTPLSYAEFLDLEAESASLSKGQRTRCRFTAGAARILGSKGYHSMQMSDICAEVGLSQGAIYKYFGNKKEISLEVMSGFVERRSQLLHAVHPQGEPYWRTYQVNLEYVRFFAHNVGLMRCMRQLSAEIDEFRDIWHRANSAWNEVIARHLRRSVGEPHGTDEAAFILANSLGGMVDEFLHEVYVRRHPILADLANAPERLAETVSIIWHRQAYAGNPTSERARASNPLLRLRLEAE